MGDGDVGLADAELVYFDVDGLSPHAENYRRGDVEKIRESIRTNSFYGVVYVQNPAKAPGRRARRRPRILAGEHRWKAAKLEGLDRVPCWVLDVDDAAADRILAADNLTSDAGENDPRLLAELLAGIAGEEPALWDERLLGTGADAGYLEALVADLEPPDFSPVDPGDQPRLDRRNEVECPECGHTFAP